MRRRSGVVDMYSPVDNVYIIISRDKTGTCVRYGD